jgi:hypothetical protein
VANYHAILQDVKILTAGRLSDEILAININRAYQQILEAHPWSQLRATQVIQTFAAKNSGTVSVHLSHTAVQGTGTDFQDSDAGSFIWIGGVNVAPIEVLSVVSPTQLELAHPWPGPTQIGVSYFLVPLFYRIPQAREVLEVYELQRLTKVTRDVLNRVDPLRTAGGSLATHWAPAPPARDGSLRIELWPTPQGPRGYVVEYIVKPKPLEIDEDEPIVPYEIVEHRSLELSFLQLFAASGNTAYQALAEKYGALYREALEEAIRQDRRILAHQSQVTAEAPATNDAALRYLQAVQDKGW